VLVSEIYSILDKIAPFELQDDWDNSGLLLGNLDDEFDKIYLSIDANLSLAKKVEPNSLVITHHPLIFNPLKSLDPKTFPANIIYELIKKDVKLISMHLNFDKAVFNNYLVQEHLGYKITKSKDYEVYFEPNKSFDEFAKELQEKFSQPCIRVAKTTDFVKTAVFCSGAGGSLLKELDSDADCFITGDIKHSQGIEARDLGISLVEIGHYESESFFSTILQKKLEDKGINAIIADIDNPFNYIKG